MRLTSVVALVLACSVNAATAGDTAAPPDSPAVTFLQFYQRHVSDLRYGRCFFEPSCSQYALDAVDRNGMFVGAALTTDRLIRCHAGARSYHARSAGGRLLDPVGHVPGAVGRPRIPDWLLPTPKEQALPSGLDATAERSARIRDYAAYGDQLADEGHCIRAETEYGRAGFLAGTPEARAWAKRKAALCLFRSEDWAEAADRFLEAGEAAASEAFRNHDDLMAAVSLFDAGEYARCANVARSVTGAERERGTFLLGLASMALGDWDEAIHRFRTIDDADPASPNRDRALFLRWKASEGDDVARKRPHLAAGLSAVVPGSGQMYVGRTRDGVRHLLVTGTLAYGVVRLLRAESYVGGSLLAGFTLPFYAGNVAGAKRSADWYNASRRAAYLSRVIVDAGRE